MKNEPIECMKRIIVAHMEKADNFVEVRMRNIPLRAIPVRLFHWDHLGSLIEKREIVWGKKVGLPSNKKIGDIDGYKVTEWEQIVEMVNNAIITADIHGIKELDIRMDVITSNKELYYKLYTFIDGLRKKNHADQEV